MTHRYQYSPRLQRELKVREVSGSQKLVTASLGLGLTATLVVLGIISFAVIPH
jgi:hypothetical protein